MLRARDVAAITFDRAWSLGGLPRFSFGEGVTFRLHHEWTEGPTLPTGVALATCAHCETLRATNLGRVPLWRRALRRFRGASATSVFFIRRKAEEVERVVRVEPPCISAAAFFKSPW